MAQGLGDKSLECQALIGLGNTYCGERQNQEGLQAFAEALEIADPRSYHYQKALNGKAKAKKFLDLDSSRGNSNRHSSHAQSQRNKGYRQQDRYHSSASRQEERRSDTHEGRSNEQSYSRVEKRKQYDNDRNYQHGKESSPTTRRGYGQEDWWRSLPSSSRSRSAR